jgi:hypothetical protein
MAQSSTNNTTAGLSEMMNSNAKQIHSDQPTQSGRTSQVDQMKNQDFKANMLAANNQNLASQIYSQQKHKNGSQAGLQTLMTNGHLLNGAPALNCSMVVSNHNQPSLTIQ